MPDDPFTPAELEAAHDEIVDVLDMDWTSPDDGDEAWRAAKAVLAAVAPLIAARVRAEEREAIAAAIEATLVPGISQGLVGMATHNAAAIAHAHRTTPGDDHAG